MKSLPKPPNFQKESDVFFLAIYNRAIDGRERKVQMSYFSTPDMRHNRAEIYSDWKAKGYGTYVEHINEAGEDLSYFELSDKGIKRGKQISDSFARQRSFRRMKKNFWPAVSAVAALLAAIAASFAAYFSYLNLQGN